MTTKRNIDENFYFGMALLLAAIVVYGFSHTIGDSLVHPAEPPPPIFYVHAPVFAAWVIWFIVQTGLIRIRNPALHRRLGWIGLVLGGAVPVLGVATAVVSQRSSTDHSFFAISLNDMLLFATSFWLAVYWRRKPEFHKRLMLVATCSLMGAALARFPMVPGIPWAYGGIDVLILFGMVRDLVVDRKLHAVFRYALPCVVAGQMSAIYLATTVPPAYLGFLRFIFG